MFAAFISTQWTYISRELALKPLDLVVLLPKLLPQLLDLEVRFLLRDEGDGGEVAQAGQRGQGAVTCSKQMSILIIYTKQTCLHYLRPSSWRHQVVAVCPVWPRVSCRISAQSGRSHNCVWSSASFCETRRARWAVTCPRCLRGDHLRLRLRLPGSEAGESREKLSPDWNMLNIHQTSPEFHQ